MEDGDLICGQGPIVGTEDYRHFWGQKLIESNENYLTNQPTEHLCEEESLRSYKFLSRKIPRMLWNPRFIALFTTARHLPLTLARSIHSTPFHHIY